MTSRAEGDEVSLGIRPGLAAELRVVNSKIGHGSARLASPAVPTENLTAKLVVRFAVQAKAWVLWSDTIHEASSVA
jgi:hypothetical protein